MIWKILNVAACLALSVLVTSLSVVGIRNSRAAAAANDEFVCGTIRKIDYEKWRAFTDNILHPTHDVPSPEAFGRLKVGKEFTFIYRKDQIIAIADGNLCKK
jgi:hypothetical protein